MHVMHRAIYTALCGSQGVTHQVFLVVTKSFIDSYLQGQTTISIEIVFDAFARICLLGIRAKVATWVAVVFVAISAVVAAILDPP